MKHIDLELDEDLLEQARRITGETSDSAAVAHVVKEFLRLKRLEEGLRELRGSGCWEGDLSEMRGDRVRPWPEF